MASGDDTPPTLADATPGTVPGVSAANALAGGVVQRLRGGPPPNPPPRDGPPPPAPAGGAVQRLGGAPAATPPAEDAPPHRLADVDSGRKPGVGDRAPDRMAVAAGRHAPADLAADAHRLVSQRDRALVVEHQAAQG